MRKAYPLGLMCELYQVSRSGYYAWCDRGPSRRSIDDEALSVQIRAIHMGSKRSYGSLRIKAELAAQGHPVGRRRIMKLMLRDGLRGRRRRRRIFTTETMEGQAVVPNRLLGQPKPVRTNQLWVTDITYIPTNQGTLYMAAVLDAFSRRLIGWSFGPQMGANLCTQALRMAVRQRRPLPGLVHHSDQGMQYLSNQYRQALADIGAVSSMSRKGNCYDNAIIESFWSTMKLDCLEGKQFHSRQQATVALFEYVISFYNRTRRHSSLGYLSPVAFEKLNN
jgi:putative transposase